MTAAAAGRHDDHKPCLVSADGFYEWQKLPGGEKQAYFITTALGEPFAFAGLWECWRAKVAPRFERTDLWTVNIGPTTIF